jgi:hypothetical protein
MKHKIPYQADDICVGYKETKGKCENKAGTAWSPYWCEQCNRVRLDTISEQLEEISQRWNDPPSQINISQ